MVWRTICTKGGNIYKMKPNKMKKQKKKHSKEQFEIYKIIAEILKLIIETLINIFK